MSLDPGSVPLDPRLAEDYLAIATHRGSKTLEATALRTRSRAARDLIAYATAPGLNLDADTLIAQLRDARETGVEPFAINHEWAHRLARVVGLQNLDEHGRDDAVVLYEAIRRQHGPTGLGSAAQKTFTEMLWETGRHERLRSLLPEFVKLRAHTRRYVDADLANPFIRGTDDPDDLATWYGLVDEIFAEHDVEPIRVRPGTTTAFDGLTCDVDDAITSGPRVSVIMTAYHPGPELVTSVRSICDQTWRNLEIIIVDDGSGDAYDDVLDDCAALDPRVRVVRLEHNGGTYRARNAGLDAATGDFVTCQDADDWSHPRRIELQAQALLADPEIPATRSYSIRVSPNLIFQRPGYEPTRPNASSLMFRRDQALTSIGYFDNSRKGADTEYMKRLEIALGATTADIRAPLAMVRMADVSLSRADFALGWHHVSRFVYQGAYARWHARLAETGGDPYLPREPVGKRPFAIPQRFRIDQDAVVADPPAYDLIFLSEWRRYGGPQKSMMEEIAALTHAGYRVGVAHLEAFRFMGNLRHPLCPEILDLINSGVVDFVALDQVASAKLVVIRYPPVLQFGPSAPSTLDVDQVMILANQAPHEADGSDRRYTVATCDATVRFLFGVDPTWVAQGESIKSVLDGSVPADRFRPTIMPGIIDPAQWSVPRRRFRSDRPVIGRHSRDDLMKWPATAADVLEVYPDDGSVDVRFMGGDEILCEIMGWEHVPPAWISYRRNEVPVREFLSQLDFFVYYQNPIAVEAFGRAILEAVAAGCVTILPPHFAPTFGEAAVYAEPHDVQRVVAEFYADHKAYRDQVERGLEVVRTRFSHASYVADIAGIIGPPSAR